MDCSYLRFLLDNKRSAALRARLGNGHVWGCEVTVRIARAAIEDARTPAAAFSGAAAADKFALIALGTFDPQSDGARVLALRIAGAADEFAEAAMLLYQAVPAKSALFVEWLIGLVCDASALDKAARGFAIGIALAGEESAEAAALDNHFLAAIIAILNLGLTGVRRKLWREILDEIAVGITRAA